VTTTQAFTPLQLRELRTEMEQELAWLLRSLIGKGTTGAASSNDGLKRGAPAESAEMENVLRRRAQSRLADILASLEKLDNGSYGECVSCGRRIPYSRLALVPESTYCIACGGRLGIASPQPGG
jgi:RNA polymerase-binding transcription factor DksA